MIQNDTKNTSNYINSFVCKTRDFICSKKGDWSRHILTAKHKNLTNSNICDKKNIYNCNICNKSYKSRNGLWNHNKKCQSNNLLREENNKKIEGYSDKEIIIMLIKENA
jgi:hypothetical protein